jgi:DNA-binding transcriptional MocR family regulator
MRQLYRAQRDALGETLMRRAGDRLDVAVPDQGMHLVAYLRDGSSDIAVEASAQRAGIVPGYYFWLAALALDGRTAIRRSTVGLGSRRAGAVAHPNADD